MGLKVVFMGTPDFAVATLDAIVKSKHKVVAVVTSPDKPAGRGLQLQMSEVKQYALQQNIPVLQPEKLKDESFIENLKSFNADVFVVVAFRMLPEVVWAMPAKGTINVHASLLPQYRGAAPINRVIMNGETVTGVTTFFIEREIDTGQIIKQSRVKIEPSENASSLYEKLKVAGANILIETLDGLESNTLKPIGQQMMIDKSIPLNEAPKIFKEDCKIDWNKSKETIFNHIRGLSMYPAAWTALAGPKPGNVKIYTTSKLEKKHNLPNGTIETDNKSYIHVAVNNGMLAIETLQLEGKKRLNVDEFLRGFQQIELYHFE